MSIFTLSDQEAFPRRRHGVNAARIRRKNILFVKKGSHGVLTASSRRSRRRPRRSCGVGDICTALSPRRSAFLWNATRTPRERCPSVTGVEGNSKSPQAGLIPEIRCGFRKGKQTIYIIFTSMQFQKKWQEQNVVIYILYYGVNNAQYGNSSMLIGAF